MNTLKQPSLNQGRERGVQVLESPLAGECEKIKEHFAKNVSLGAILFYF